MVLVHREEERRLTTTTRTRWAYDTADLSSGGFWAATAVDRERVFAELRNERPISWHRPVENCLLDDPDDPGFWAVVRHEDFVSGQGIVFDSIPQELLDAGQGFIAMDRPRHTQIRRLLVSAFTPRQMARVAERIEANARRAVDDIAELGDIEVVAELAALIPCTTSAT